MAQSAANFDLTEPPIEDRAFAADSFRAGRSSSFTCMISATLAIHGGTE